MNAFQDRYGSWAIVAGAAEGLGEAFCKALAMMDINIVLVDWIEESMTDLAARLEADFGIETRCIYQDLADNRSTEKIMESISDLDCRLLIYNAAFSTVKPFLSNSPEDLDYFIGVNCNTPLKLTHAFSKSLGNKKSGGILLMSSLAGLWGTRLVGPYGATKAFNLNLAEALYYELKESNIDIMACIAGATATRAYLDTNPNYGLIKPQVQKPETVAANALKHFGRQPYYISGSFNRMTYFLFTRILSRKKALRTLNKTMVRMYSSKY
jgi:short-subunit dehydrogenase